MLLLRLQNPQSPTKDISHNDGRKHITPVRKDLGNSFLQSLPGLITGPEKDNQNKESTEAQPCSSAYDHEYLSDAAEIDYVDSVSLLKSSPGQLSNVSPSSLICSEKMKETASKSFSSNDAGNGTSREVDTCMSENAIDQNGEKYSTSGIEVTNLEAVQKNNQLMSSSCSGINCDLSADQTDQKQQCEYLGALVNYKSLSW